MFDNQLSFDTAPYRLSGLVYGTLLNDGAALAALGSAVTQAPYKAAPKAPILYIKPRNTLAANGADVPVPAGCAALQIGAALGLVIGRTASRLTEANALDCLAGYTLVADISVPHETFYRPSVRFKALDDSCFVGPRVVSRASIADPGSLQIRVSVDGVELQRASTAGMVRSAARLLVDVSEFMTLCPGDVLMLGVAAGAPNAKPGQSFSIESEAIGTLRGRLVAEKVVAEESKVHA